MSCIISLRIQSFILVIQHILIIIVRKEKETWHIELHPSKVISFIYLYCLKQNLQCGESVTIEGQTYTISAVTLRYQLRKGKYEQSEKRLDVLSTGRYLVNLYFENLLEQSWWMLYFDLQDVSDYFEKLWELEKTFIFIKLFSYKKLKSD